MRRRHALAAALLGPALLAAAPVGAAEPYAAAFAEGLRVQQPHERSLHLVLSLPGAQMAEVQTRHMRLISAPDRVPEQRGLVLAAGQALGQNGPEGILSALVPIDRIEALLAEIRRDGTIVAEISRLGDLAARETALAGRLSAAQTLRGRLADLQVQATDPVVAYQAFTQAQSEVNRLTEELEAVRFGRLRAAIAISYVASDADRPQSPSEVLDRQVRLAGHIGMAATPAALLLGLLLAGLVSRSRRAKAAAISATPPASPTA
jgi:hypothetical protein